MYCKIVTSLNTVQLEVLSLPLYSNIAYVASLYYELYSIIGVAVNELETCAEARDAARLNWESTYAGAQEITWRRAR
jgi:hypothetical protein